MARSTPDQQHRQKRCKADSSLKKSADSAMKCNELKTQYIKSTRRRCPCTEARCIEQTNFTVPINRRKIYLVASSFLDIDSTEGNDGI